MNESLLRSIIREELLEAAGGPKSKIYKDDAGYSFQIQNGKLMLVSRPPGAPGKNPLPFQIRGDTLQKTIPGLIERYPNDAQLAALSSPGAPKSPSSPGLILGKKTGKDYPVTAAQIKAGNDFIHRTPAGTENCSEWAGKYVGFQGNAWIANRKGVMKYDAFSNVNSYKAAAEKLFRDMNAARGLNVESSKTFNTRVQAIVSSLLPSPSSLAASMQIGDIIGMYNVGSKHHGEAFFESCSGWSMTSKSQVVSTCVQTADGKGWSPTMMGKRLNFVVIRPFAMNTHLGYVGGTIDGDPLIFHNMGGQVHVNRLSRIKATGVYPVWIKQGNYSTPAAGSGGGGGGWLDRLKSLFPE